MERADAQVLVDTLSKYEVVFLDHYMVHEGGVMPPEESVRCARGRRTAREARPLDPPLPLPVQPASAQKGLVTFVSFLMFGSVPLAVFLVGDTVQQVLARSPLLVSTAASAVTMFVLGALSGVLTQQVLAHRSPCPVLRRRGREGTEGREGWRGGCW